jgi:hypothetical protein
LFALSADIVRSIESYKKTHKKSDILWRGVPYLDICRMEKWEVENKMKDEIRE